MHFHSLSADMAIRSLNSNKTLGLSPKDVRSHVERYGENTLTQKKKKGIFAKILSALKEPMLIILLFGFCIALGANVGKQLKTGDGDFGECFGILFAVVLSVSITLIMEGSSERAFQKLSSLYDNVTVRVIRGGEVIVIQKRFITVGDILLLEGGDKIVADGRLIESDSLLIDEAALTGESVAVRKDASAILDASTPLAERINCVYSGTFVTSGTGKMIVTAVGDKSEIGAVAGELDGREAESSPLQQKLAKLGKIITILGGITAVTVFIISVVRLAMFGGLTFNSVQELFISCIVLIVAAVPEGMPTIVAVSLALNMIKLAKDNALIKKMTATETAGAVSVICSDKTGTLTKNRMTVEALYVGEQKISANKIKNAPLLQNFSLNSTAEVSVKGGQTVCRGSGTECALLVAYNQSLNTTKQTDESLKQTYSQMRKSARLIERVPFSSETKFMTSTYKINGVERTFLKGAPEKVLEFCSLTSAQKNKIIKQITLRQKEGARVLCFAHRDNPLLLNDGLWEKGNKGTKAQKQTDAVLDKKQKVALGGFTYDGFVTLADPIREEVFKAIKECKSAGIRVKILTGDNAVTAFSIAKQLGIAKTEGEVVSATELDKLDDFAFKKALQKISVIARSTPIIKLRVVRALKEMGEIVAVTGDGINDAPAIKHADVGISMGISGSEITKEASDVVLIDDSFATVVKTISFGRNVYRNLQRFILFQLSVNLSALFFITAAAILGLEAPFGTLQLLWINIIMDGPPALTLGLERASENIMQSPPVKRNASIVSAKMLLRIAFSGLWAGVILTLQYLYNFLGASNSEKGSAVWTLFILFQLFNAFNSRELGADSVFKRLGKNKIMLLTFAGVLLAHVLIVQCFSSLFAISPMRLEVWFRCVGVASSVLIVSELYKWIYRILKDKGLIKMRAISYKSGSKDNEKRFFINKFKRGGQTN